MGMLQLSLLLLLPAVLQQEDFPDYGAVHTQDSARLKGNRAAGGEEHGTDVLMGLTEQVVEPQHGENGHGGGLSGAAAAGGGVTEFGGSHGGSRTPLKPVPHQEGNVQGPGGQIGSKGEAEEGVVKSQGFQQPQQQQQEHVGEFGGRPGW